MSKPKASSIVILVLLVISVFLGIKYFSVVKELSQTQALLQIQTTNQKVVEFTKLFIDEVLKADSEVSFDTRLKLEIAVSNIGDEEIVAQWHKFVDSKTEIEAQEEVKILLKLLVSKVIV